jgi:hypothetical protein
MQVKTKNLPLILFAGVLILIFAGGLFAREDPNQQGKSFLAKPSADRVGRTLSNIGNWSYWIYNTGTSGNDPNGDPGGVYPRATAAVIFTDGLVWGGYVQDTISQNPRVGGVTYQEGVQQGWITSYGNGLTWESATAIDPNDPRAAMWRVRNDYQSLTLEQVRQDAAELNLVDANNVTEAQMQAVLDQYAYDWENWPTDLGAPFYDVDGDGIYTPGVEIDLNGDGQITVGEREEPGIAKADQIVWCVYNDLNDGKTVALYGAQPMGIELQSTTWQYNQPGATLGQLIFRKYTFINKSGADIDSMFVCQWSDCDVGNYTDDFAGCDTTRSVGFAYTAFLTDADYTAFGLPPAAVGYDFFQGPAVPSPGDTAIFNLTKKADYKNLPMTSFFFFASGSPISDPDLQQYNGTLQFYNLMNGRLPVEQQVGAPRYKVGSGPLRGDETSFPLSGDPTTQQGDVDGLGDNLQPGDRRIGLNSGPFTMAAGDTQEVVVAIVGGIVAQAGGNNRNAVVQMKLNDDFAQFIYDNLFEAIPRAPQAPKVTATALENQIVLEWGSNQAAVAVTEAPDPLLGFNFEGYNVYQLPSAAATVDQATKIATYDVANGVTTIYATKFVGTIGDIVTIPVQKGTDSGVKRTITIDQDYLTGNPLYNGSTYYFAVTAYNYNSDPTVPEPSLESSVQPAIQITPQGNLPGVRYDGTPDELVDVTHDAGTSDGGAQAQVIDPAATTGHEYQIFFTEDTASGELLWNVKDMATGVVKVSNQKQLATVDETDAVPIFDGMQVKVTGPALDYKLFLVTANANGPVDPPEQGTFAFNNNGFPLVFNSLYPDGSDRPDGDRQQSNGSTWGLQQNDPSRSSYATFKAQTTQYTGGLGEPNQGIAYLIPRDYEIRFTGTPAPAFFRWPYLDTSNPAFMGTVPFELWCLGDNSNDPSDDYQCLPWINDVDSNGVFNLLADDHTVSGGSDDPYTDSFYWIEPLNRTAQGFADLVAAHEADPAGANAEVLWAYKTDYAPWFCVAGMMREVLVNWNGGSVTDPTFPANVDAVMPEDGTTFQIQTSKPNKLEDVFSFTAPMVTDDASTAAADVEKVNVFPNPYYAYNPQEPDRFTRFVTFNHLPVKATIRIFNLAGVQVRKLDKNASGQFMRWDLQNESGLPVASGMYIAYIDMPDQGKQKILKLMIIQSQQQLKYY